MVLLLWPINVNILFKIFVYSVNGTTSLYLGFIVLTLPALVLVSCDIYKSIRGLPTWLSGKESACQCRRLKRHGFHTWVGKIPWRRAWQPTPVFLPGESHGQRSLVGYSPWSHKELDMTEHPGGERIKEFIGFLLYVLRKFESICNSKFFPKPAPTWEPWVLSWLFCFCAPCFSREALLCPLWAIPPKRASFPEAGSLWEIGVSQLCHLWADRSTWWTVIPIIFSLLATICSFQSSSIFSKTS